MLPTNIRTIQTSWEIAARHFNDHHDAVTATQKLLTHILLQDARTKGRIAVMSSFGTEAAIPLALVASTAPDTPVLAVDTGWLFPETLPYGEELATQLRLTDIRILAPTDEEALPIAPFEGRCCGTAKKAAMERELQKGGFVAVITGRKQYQGETRASIPIIEQDLETGRIKINPLALWTEAQVDNFRAQRNLPHHPLTAQGYGSVGCWPCTRPGQGRNGRTHGANRSAECGLHVPGLHIDGSGI